MHAQVHLIIVTILSMIITFVLHCIMENIPLTKTFLQRYVIDHVHDISLFMHCFYDKSINNRTCAYFFPLHDVYYLFITFSIVYIITIIVLNCPKLFNHTANILFTLLSVEYLKQYITFLNLIFKIDTLTIYFFAWQLFSLVFDWIDGLLLPPILIIEQGSFCAIGALTAWICHFMFLRYCPLTMNLFGLWIWSIIDIFMCLHHRGELYRPYSTNQTCTRQKKGEPWTYYTRGVDQSNKGASTGLLDFITYNILVLLTLPPSSSVIKKVCIAFGAIICVEVGCILTDFLQFRKKILVAPGLPLPVMTVSIYLFILDTITTYMPNHCIEQ